MTEEGTNSGIFVYCSNIKDWIPNMVEIQITDDFHEKWAKSPKSWQCGAIFGHLPAKKSMVKKPGEWNRYTISCNDNMIHVMLNGELVFRFINTFTIKIFRDQTFPNDTQPVKS